MDLKHGLHRFDDLRGAYRPNAYWPETGDGVAIIDTGMPGSEKKILDQLRTAGKKPSDVKYLILTHPDIGHSGSAAALKRFTGAKIAIHADEMKKLTALGFDTLLPGHGIPGQDNADEKVRRFFNHD